MPKTDVYGQIAYITVTESAANTLSFSGITLFTNILEQKGMLINRVEYVVAAADVAQLDAELDRITLGISGDNSLAAIGLDDAQCYDLKEVFRVDFGTAASAELYYSPLVTDFSNMPGGGRLVPADRVYAFVKGDNLDNTVQVSVRVYFTVLDLQAAEYLELVQALRVLT